MALRDMDSTTPKLRTSAHSPSTKHDADGYGLHREEANDRRGAGWCVSIRRRGHKIVRLFKDSIHGSDDAAYAQARAYRDAIIAAVPPATNEGQKRENFSVSKFGEQAAKSMAIAKRRKWLKALPVTHLAYAHHAAEVAQGHFADDLIPVSDVMPETHLTDDEIEARIQAINDRFDKVRPKRLRVRVKSYHAAKLSVFVSDAGKPAKRKLVQINTGRLDQDETVRQAKSTVEVTIAAFYDADVAKWFMDAHGYDLLDPNRFDVRDGFNVLVFLPVELARH